MRTAIKDRTNRHKRLLFGSALILCFIVISCLALVYKSRASVPPAETDNYAGRIIKEGNLKEAGRQAVLTWMKKNSAMPENVLSHIYGIASNTVQADLILAVCCVESNYNPRAVSSKGAMGLMGIMPGVWLGELKARGIVSKKEDLYNIADNIAAGNYVLGRYISSTGNLRQALIRYEGGDSWYATRVMKTMKKISMARSSREKIYLASNQNFDIAER